MDLAGRDAQLAAAKAQVIARRKSKKCAPQMAAGAQLLLFTMSNLGITRGAIGMDDDPAVWVPGTSAGHVSRFHEGHVSGSFSEGGARAIRRGSHGK